MTAIFSPGVLSGRFLDYWRRCIGCQPVPNRGSGAPSLIIYPLAYLFQTLCGVCCDIPSPAGRIWRFSKSLHSTHQPTHRLVLCNHYFYGVLHRVYWSWDLSPFSADGARATRKETHMGAVIRKTVSGPKIPTFVQSIQSSQSAQSYQSVQICWGSQHESC